MTKVIFLFLVLAALPLSLVLVKQQQHLKSKASSISQPVVGFNVSGITHYGYNDILPYSLSSNVDADLSQIQKMNGTIIRIFVANKHISDSEAARRLDVFLTKAAAYNISAIISFIDYYGSGFNPQGTDQYYTDNYNGTLLLNRTFFESGYTGSYLNFVKTVVQANKNHSNIYAWEPGNELKDGYSPQSFINFMNNTTSTIKNIDPIHKIATGMLNAGHTGLSPTNLYPSLTNIDLITIHTYSGDHTGLTDASWAVANGKKAVIEEVGYSGTGDRSGSMRSEMDFWKAQGVTTFLQWGFIAQGLADNGNGDRDVGMDAIWHTDYNALFTLYASYAYNPAPTCDPTQVQMSVSPDPSNQGNQVTFNVSGTQGSTYLGDSWSGGVDCSGGFWDSKTCNALSGGTFEWTHTWKNCAPNDCSLTSNQCSKALNYTVNGGPTPTQPPLTPTPTIVSSMTVSNISMTSVFQKGKRNVYTTVMVINETDNKPLSATTVSVTTKFPSGISRYYLAPTNINGQVTFLTQSKEKGTYTSTVTSVVKSGFNYHPTNIFQSLSI